MKNIRSITKVIIAIFILQFISMGIIVGTSKVQLATLATDVVSECNDGWRITTADTRYDIDFSTVLISLEWEDDVSMSEVDEAMKALEYSILQSLRKVDVMSRVSESQYLIVLTEAHSQNIQMIIERVFASFFKNCQNTKIKPVYEIK